MNQGGVNEPDEVSPKALQVADGTLATHGDNPVAALRRSEKVGQTDDVADGPTSEKIISVLAGPLRNGQKQLFWPKCKNCTI